MNKLVIPSILAATVLVGAMFAIIPVEKASTIHTTILSAIASKRILTVHRSLDGIISSGGATARAVVMDTTNVGTIANGHFAAVLPAAGATCVAGANPAAGLTIKVGIAGGTLTDVLVGTSTILVGGPNVSFGGATVAQCIFHANFASGSGLVPASSTDVVFESTVTDTLPDDASITVSVTTASS